MRTFTSETELPQSAYLLGTDWQNSHEFDSVLAEQIDNCDGEVVSIKNYHFKGSDDLFAQWSKDYYCI